MIAEPMPPSAPVPAHVAVIMDGNGRWAERRGQPRAMGHRAGVRAARRLLRAAAHGGVAHLTVFAFSQENWNRPEHEVGLLMQLFVRTLGRETESLHRNGVRLRFIGEHAAFPALLREQMDRASALTAHNTGLNVTVAAGYGGQWDIAQAAQALADRQQPITTEALQAHLQTAGTPMPDLLIRTGGERRISNFLLWQLAYTELYFTDLLWPDFDEAAFAEALRWYASRERRFGRVPAPA